MIETHRKELRGTWPRCHRRPAAVGSIWGLITALDTSPSPPKKKKKKISASVLYLASPHLKWLRWVITLVLLQQIIKQPSLLVFVFFSLPVYDGGMCLVILWRLCTSAPIRDCCLFYFNQGDFFFFFLMRCPWWSALFILLGIISCRPSGVTYFFFFFF